jgi:hypothetical protein
MKSLVCRGDFGVVRRKRHGRLWPSGWPCPGTCSSCCADAASVRRSWPHRRGSRRSGASPARAGSQPGHPRRERQGADRGGLIDDEQHRAVSLQFADQRSELRLVLRQRPVQQHTPSIVEGDCVVLGLADVEADEHLHRDRLVLHNASLLEKAVTARISFESTVRGLPKHHAGAAFYAFTPRPSVGPGRRTPLWWTPLAGTACREMWCVRPHASRYVFVRAVQGGPR